MSEKYPPTESQYEEALDDLIDAVYDYIDARDNLDDFVARNGLDNADSLMNEVKDATDQIYHKGKIYRDLEDDLRYDNDTDDEE